MQYDAADNTRKQTKKINAEYSLEGTILQNVDKIKYLGVTITEDSRWNTHLSNICTKANRTLGFLRQNFYPCPKTGGSLQKTGVSSPGPSCINYFISESLVKLTVC